MSQISVIVKLVAAPGKRDELLAAFAGFLPTVEAEEGTLVYSVHSDSADQDAVWITEVYADEAALAAHNSSDAFKAFGGSLVALLGGPAEFHMAVPAMAKGS